MDLNQDIKKIHPDPPDPIEVLTDEDAMVIDESHPGYYQRWMHAANDKRLSNLETVQSEIQKTLGEIHANTLGLPELKKDVDSLKADRQKVMGMKDTLSLIWLLATPVISFFVARFAKH